MIKERKRGRGMFIFICILAFIISFSGSAIFKITYKPKWAKKYSADWNDSMEIKDAMPVIIEEAENLGYNLNEMAISGGSAGGTLAMLYAYRDAEESPIPVKMMFEMVGPSSFFVEDWGIYGLDKNDEAAG